MCYVYDAIVVEKMGSFSSRLWDIGKRDTGGWGNKNVFDGGQRASYARAKGMMVIKYGGVVERMVLVTKENGPTVIVMWRMIDKHTYGERSIINSFV